MLSGQLIFYITFSNGGSAVENATVNHGEKLSKPADPTKKAIPLLAGSLILITNCI